jgi:tRNA-specific 2-thiouridylase
VLVAMSGGVDSSVAVALLKERGHEVVGATMKLWGGQSDTGCCSVADVDDARRVAQQLGVAHHVFNFGAEFDRHVVEPYVSDHASGLTPNPCVECNRHLKFDRFLERAMRLGFDAIATGHHARVVAAADGRWELRRGADSAKDQSYVLHMLGQEQLSRTLLPVGDLTKSEVRDVATSLRLRTAAKPDSQDVCFISRAAGRETFLGDRIPLRPASVRDQHGNVLGELPSVELVTVGQRRGLGGLGTAEGSRRYVLSVDSPAATVTVGALEDLMVGSLRVSNVTWVSGPPSAEPLEVQMSAHGRPVGAVWRPGQGDSDGVIEVEHPVRRVAPGQSVVLYRGEAVVGGGIAA